MKSRMKNRIIASFLALLMVVSSFMPLNTVYATNSIKQQTNVINETQESADITLQAATSRIVSKSELDIERWLCDVVANLVNNQDEYAWYTDPDTNQQKPTTACTSFVIRALQMLDVHTYSSSKFDADAFCPDAGNISVSSKVKFAHNGAEYDLSDLEILTVNPNALDYNTLEIGDILVYEQDNGNGGHVGIYIGQGTKDQIKAKYGIAESKFGSYGDMGSHWAIHGGQGSVGDFGSIKVVNTVTKVTNGKGNLKYIIKLNEVPPNDGYIDLQKKSTADYVTSLDGYSFQNAQYGVWTDKATATAATAADTKSPTTILTTDANGYAKSGKLTVGTYYVKELVAPKGYRLDSNVYTVTVVADITTRVNGQWAFIDSTNPDNLNKLPETPYLDPTDIYVKKANNNNQAIVIKGAIYRINYYEKENATLAECQSMTPNATWYLETDTNGLASLDSSHIVNNATYPSSAFYLQGNAAVVPIGTITIQEVYAPPEYECNSEIHIRHITSDSIHHIASTNTPTAPTLSKENPLVRLAIQKADALTGVLMSNTTYGVYADAACTQSPAKNGQSITMTTGQYAINNDVASYGGTYGYVSFVPKNTDAQITYYVKELSVSTNHMVDPTVYAVTANSAGDIVVIKTNQAANQPHVDFGWTRVQLTKTIGNHPGENLNVDGATYYLYYKDSNGAYQPVTYNYPSYINTNNYSTYCVGSYHQPTDQVTMTTNTSGTAATDSFFPTKAMITANGTTATPTVTVYALEEKIAAGTIASYLDINTQIYQFNCSYLSKNDAPYQTSTGPVYDYGHVQLKINKIDGNIKTANKYLDSATYTVYEDAACTIPVKYNYPEYITNPTASKFYDKNGITQPSKAYVYHTNDLETNYHNANDVVTMTTKADGSYAFSGCFYPSATAIHTLENGVPVYTYYVKETSNVGLSQNYDLNPTVYPVTVKLSQTGIVNNDYVNDYGHVQLKIQKHDANTNSNLLVPNATYTVYRDSNCTNAITYNYPDYIKTANDYILHTNDSESNYHNANDIVTMTTNGTTFAFSGWFYPSDLDEYEIDSTTKLPVYTYYVKETAKTGLADYRDINPAIYKVTVTYDQTSVVKDNTKDYVSDFGWTRAIIYKTDGNIELNNTTNAIAVEGATYSLYYNDNGIYKPVTYNYPSYITNSQEYAMYTGEVAANYHQSTDQVTMITNNEGIGATSAFYPTSIMFDKNNDGTVKVDANGLPTMTLYAVETSTLQPNSTTEYTKADFYDLNPTIYNATFTYINKNTEPNAYVSFNTNEKINSSVDIQKDNITVKDFGHVGIRIRKTDGNLNENTLNPLWITGATYTVYEDEACTIPVKYNYPDYIKDASNIFMYPINSSILNSTNKSLQAYLEYTSICRRNHVFVSKGQITPATEFIGTVNDYHLSTDVVTMTTKADGEFAFSGWFYPSNSANYVIDNTTKLPVYTYYIKETSKTNQANYRELNPCVYKITISYEQVVEVTEENNITISSTSDPSSVLDYGWVQAKIKKLDKETKNPLTRVTFEIYEDEACTIPVKYNYPNYITASNWDVVNGSQTEYKNTNSIVTMTTNADGWATTSAFYPSSTAQVEIKEIDGIKLPFYTYYVKETLAPSLYFVESNLTKTSIVHKMEAVTYYETAMTKKDSLLNTDNNDTYTENEQYKENTTEAENFAVKGWLELFKEDSKINAYSKYKFANNPLTKMTSSAAQFAGSKYQLIAAETIYHPDGVTTGSEMGISDSTQQGVLFEQGDVIKTAKIVRYDENNKPVYEVVNSTGIYATNEYGYLQIGSSDPNRRDSDDLWIGNYILKEIPNKVITHKEQVTTVTNTYNTNGNGYYIDTTEYLVNVSYEGQDVKKVKATITNQNNEKYVISNETAILQKFSLIKYLATPSTTEVVDKQMAGIGFYVKNRLDLGRYAKTNLHGEFLDINGDITTNPEEYVVLYKYNSKYNKNIEYDVIYDFYELEYNTTAKNEEYFEKDYFGNDVLPNVKIDKNGNVIQLNERNTHAKVDLMRSIEAILNENPKLIIDGVSVETTDETSTSNIVKTIKVTDIDMNTIGAVNAEQQLTDKDNSMHNVLANAKILVDDNGNYHLGLPKYDYPKTMSPNDEIAYTSDIKATTDKYGQFEYWDSAINYGPDMITTTTDANGNIVEVLKDNYDQINSKTSKTDSDGIFRSIPLPYGVYAVEESGKDALDFIDSKGNATPTFSAGTFDIIINNDTISQFGAYVNNTETQIDGKNQGMQPFKIAVDNLDIVIRVAKYDKDTEETVLLSGATFKIYKIENDYEDGEQIKTMSLVTHSDFTSGSKRYKSTWTTDNSGQVVLGGKDIDYYFDAGQYIIEEIETPAGYYISNEDHGFKYIAPNAFTTDFNIQTDVENKTFTVDEVVDENDNIYVLDVFPSSNATVITAQEDADTNLIYTINSYNQPQPARIKVSKTGEVLTGYDDTTYVVSKDNDGNVIMDNMGKPLHIAPSWVTFKYETQGLPGAVFEIYATETVYSADHQFYYDKVQKAFPDWTISVPQGSLDNPLPEKILKYSEIEANEFKELFINYGISQLSKDEIAELEPYRTIAQITNSQGETVLVKEGALLDTITTAYDEYTINDKHTHSQYTVKRGEAISVDLPNDTTYKVVEVVAPYGKVLPENIAQRSKEVKVEYAGPEVAEVLELVEFEDDRQKVELNIEKIDAMTGDPIIGQAEFTLYNSEDIYNTQDLNDPQRQLILEKETAIETQKTDSNGKIIFSANGTLPHGKYYANETRTPAGYYSLSNADQNSIVFDASYTENTQTHPILSVNQTVINIPTVIRFNKLDWETNQPISGTKLEIVKPYLDENGDYITMTDEFGNETIQGKVLESWTTDANETFVWHYDGKTYKGHPVYYLEVGETYVLREAKASNGYVNIDKSNPDCQNDNEGYNTTYKETFFTVQNVEYDDNGNIITSMQNITMYNDHVHGKIFINKVGEFLTGVNEETIEYTDASEVITNILYYTFNFENAAVSDIQYTVYAAEDIKHPDGVSQDYYKAGDKICELVTNEFGIAMTNELPLGSYKIVETHSNNGLIKDTNEYVVELTYDNQWTRVVANYNGYTNHTAKMVIEVEKFMDLDVYNKYLNENEEALTETYKVPSAKYGLYAAEDIMGYEIIETTIDETIDDINNTQYTDKVKVVSRSDVLLIEKDTLLEIGYTDNDGALSFVSELPYGVYYIQEMEAPDGYHIDYTKYYINHKPEDEVKSINEFEITINEKPTVVAFSKLVQTVKLENGEVIETIKTENFNEGATLQVINKETGKVVDEWITSKTIHYTKNLTVGKEYILQETSPADGFTTAQPIEFTVLETVPNEVIEEVPTVSTKFVEINIIDKNGNPAVATITIDGEEIVVNKTYTIKDEIIEDMVREYDIKCEKATSISATTTKNSIVDGVDVIYETIEIIVEESEDTDNSPIKADFTNATTTKYTLMTNDNNYFYGFNGQTFNVYAKDIETEQIVWIDTVTINLHTFDLRTIDQYTDYTLKGIENPINNNFVDLEMQINDEVTINWPMQNIEDYNKVIDENIIIIPDVKLNNVFTNDTFDYENDTLVEVQNITMYDQETLLSIKKTDIVTGEEIPGATLQILTEDGTVCKEWTSTEEEYIITGLPIGNYILRETLAPTNDGYVKAEDIKFSINDTLELQKVEMKDDFTKVEISKKDITTKEELPGATLQIIDATGEVYEEWVSTDKPHKIEKMPTGQYTLREITSPDGYLISEDVMFIVEETGEIQTVVMEDDYTKLHISKQDITNKKELPGAHLQILDSKGNVYEEWVSTDEQHVIERIPVGTYTLIETSAPKGYKIAEKITFEVKETGEVQTVVMYDEVDDTKTGDTHNNIIWYTLSFISASGLMYMAYKKKKEDSDNEE